MFAGPESYGISNRMAPSLIFLLTMNSFNIPEMNTCIRLAFPVHSNFGVIRYAGYKNSGASFDIPGKGLCYEAA
jgi:hypothetical protein